MLSNETDEKYDVKHYQDDQSQRLRSIQFLSV